MKQILYRNGLLFKETSTDRIKITAQDLGIAHIAATTDLIIKYDLPLALSNDDIRLTFELSEELALKGCVLTYASFDKGVLKIILKSDIAERLAPQQVILTATVNERYWFRHLEEKMIGGVIDLTAPRDVKVPTKGRARRKKTVTP